MRAVALLLLLVATPAYADFRLDGWYPMGGLSIGGAMARDRGKGFVMGGVLSVVHLDDDLAWYGVEANLAMDTNGSGPTGARYSVGPEVGSYFFGVQAGYFGERLDGETRHGIEGTFKLTVGVIGFYARVSHVTSSDADPNSVELGMQVKSPLGGKSR